MSEQNTVDTALKIVQEFAAPVEKVYAAWSDPDQMAKWMGPGEVSCERVEIDLKVGGKYMIHMVGEDGDHIAVGEYKEIVPNAKLTFTWSWKSGTVENSLVTAEFAAKGDSTELTLTHENFPEKDTAQKHTQGWNGCLANLDAFLKGA